MEKRKFLNLAELELRPLGLPAPNQSLYRLRGVLEAILAVTKKITLLVVYGAV
jgi:hypothetical protein